MNRRRFLATLGATALAAAVPPLVAGLSLPLPVTPNPTIFIPPRPQLEIPPVRVPYTHRARMVMTGLIIGTRAQLQYSPDGERWIDLPAITNTEADDHRFAGPWHALPQGAEAVRFVIAPPANGG
jgi:hypothetical protein